MTLRQVEIEKNKVEEPELIHTYYKTIAYGQQTSLLPQEVLKHVKEIPCPGWKRPSLAQ